MQFEGWLLAFIDNHWEHDTWWCSRNLLLEWYSGCISNLTWSRSGEWNLYACKRR